MDKRWDRSLEEQPTYVIFAPNYRMNELSGAVALAQVHKMRNTVALRRARGNLLRELSKNPYVVLQRILGGCKHTYWLYAMRVTDNAPFTPDDFAMAIRAEGISCTPHFLGGPSSFLTRQSATSGFSATPVFRSIILMRILYHTTRTPLQTPRKYTTGWLSDMPDLPLTNSGQPSF